jgi:hypothetical protein
LHYSISWLTVCFFFFPVTMPTKGIIIRYHLLLYSISWLSAFLSFLSPYPYSSREISACIICCSIQSADCLLVCISCHHSHLGNNNQVSLLIYSISWLSACFSFLSPFPLRYHLFIQSADCLPFCLSCHHSHQGNNHQVSLLYSISGLSAFLSFLSPFPSRESLAGIICCSVQSAACQLVCLSCPQCHIHQGNHQHPFTDVALLISPHTKSFIKVVRPDLILNV